MINVLSVINANKWSWSFVLFDIIDKLRNYGFTTILWDPTKMVDRQSIKSSDIVLLQNVDATPSVDDKSKVVCRIGGLLADNDNPGNRYDKELSEVAAVVATNYELYNIGARVNDECYLIPNGVDLDVFKPGKNEVIDYSDKRPFVVGFAGNTHGAGRKYKGWDLFVKATQRLRPDIDTLTFLFRHNQIPHDDMPKEFYHKIDCLVLPSVAEGCSNVTMEALACGVPVLITKVGFHGEKLDDGSNCLFIERDVDDIIEKIKLLMTMPALRDKLSINGRLFAEVNHDINKVALEYDRVFKIVLEKQ